MEAENDLDDIDGASKSKLAIFLKWFKIGILVVVWCIFTTFLLLKHEHEEKPRLLTVPANSAKDYPILEEPRDGRLGVFLKGAFVTPDVIISESDKKSELTMQVQRLLYDGNNVLIDTQSISETVNLDILDPTEVNEHNKDGLVEKILEITIPADDPNKPAQSTKMVLHLTTNLGKDFPLQLTLNDSPIVRKEGVIYAAVVLLALYVLIIWDIVHRTFAAILASTLAIGILAILNNRPTMATIMSWIDEETLLLLFGMMVIVAILSDTGVFDYLAVLAYKVTRGKIWPLIYCLCVFTAFFSSFLDNVTTVLLMTPVTIRLCEVMTINPIPVLMCMVFASNIGGTLTPVGDPPNVIIASNHFISRHGVNFAIFTLHMLIPVIFIMLTTMIQIRLLYRNLDKYRGQDSSDIEGLKHEISVWKHAAGAIAPYTKDEEEVHNTLLSKAKLLRKKLRDSMGQGPTPGPDYQKTLTELQSKYPIRNKILLYKSCVALVFVVGLFFLHALPQFQSVSLGWTALLGAILLLILADVEDLDVILARVEWSTLMFFAALFVLMEALSELGLIEMIGHATEHLILSVGPESRLMVALMLMIWVSAITSAFVDNIPLTTMMVKVTISLAQNKSLHLPLQPLVWALALGACLGGNGTLIGASANVVCAGVAEQHGYKITFIAFFKMGFPIMIMSIIFSSVYLLICHVAFEWH